MPTVIHRANLAGRPVCGGQGPVRLSVTGARTAVTCPECQATLTPAQDASLAAHESLRQAAAIFRANHAEPLTTQESHQLAHLENNGICPWAPDTCRDPDIGEAAYV